MEKMNKKQLYTEELKEHIYFGEEQENNEINQKQIKDFLTELYNRRRNDPYEGGLQAEMIVMPNAFAAKVNENDGYDYHKITGVNLLRYIKKEDKFYKKEAVKQYGLLYNEANEILNNGVEIRVLDGKSSIIFAILSNKGIKSQFQIDTIRTLIDNLRNMQRKRLYTHVKVGFSTMTVTVDTGDVKEEMYNKLLKALEQEEKSLKKTEEENCLEK